MNKRITIGLTALLTGSAVLGGQVFAQSSVNITVVAGYVVKDTPNTKLELYVNDKNPVKATVNPKDWATFRNVKLVGSGKISFTKLLTGGGQRPINYTRHYNIVSGKVQFSSNAPASTPTAATPTTTPAATAQPTPTPAPAPSAPSCSPLTDAGNCYEPGEYCRDSDHGASGVAGDGEHITCMDNDGWRWEPN
jgi:hypothetical protein